ncbi:MAG: hypothetical protein OXF93_22240 [Acidobacteria bacterium]|nr:hypothetical protein [Acidobacteriota bacterium]
MHTWTDRRLVALAALALAGTLAAAPAATAQLERVVDPDWTMPRTPDGQPDLQGMWGNKTLTPMERPENVEGRAFLTDEEIARINQQRVVDEQARDEAPAQRYEAGGNVGGYGSYWLDAGDTVLSTGQTSLIVDPPDGRAPVKQWALDAKAYNLAHNGDHYRHMSVWDRCVSRGVPGSMLPAGYNNAYRIVQTPDHIAIQHEMIHDVRIIPLSDKPFIDSDIRQWMGDSRAHWDGDTLVVESRNFHNRGWIASSGAGRRLKGIPTSKALHVVERFRRVSAGTILWTVTIDDANVYDRPWTISMPLTQDPDYVIYEYACHEGNWAVRNALSGQRVVDARTAAATNEQ